MRMNEQGSAFAIQEGKNDPNLVQPRRRSGDSGGGRPPVVAGTSARNTGVALVAPKGADPRTPHDRDEIYVVVSGSGRFIRGDDNVAFSPGDPLFARAGEVHRFEAFTADFSAWVMFYGPMGGELRGEAGGETP